MTENEGLLKKQILEVLNQSWGGVKGTRKLSAEERVYMVAEGDDREYCTEYVVEKDEQIMKILDEAAKDVEKVIEVLRQYDTTITEEDDEYNNDEVLDAIDILKKWFGKPI